MPLPAFFGAPYLWEMLPGHLRGLLRMGEIPRIACVTSEQVLTEIERDLAEKLLEKLSEFHRSKFS